MTTRTELANLTFLALGVADVVDIDTADSPRAQKFLQAFRPISRSEFRGHGWNCAMTRANVAVSEDTPPFGYLYYYNLPADCLFPWKLNHHYYFVSNNTAQYEVNPAFKIEGRRLLSNIAGPLELEYIRDITTLMELWDPMLTEAMALNIAKWVGPGLVKNESMLKRVTEWYEDKCNQAVMVNALELPPAKIADTDWAGEMHTWG